MRYRYRPNHPLADELGFIPAELAESTSAQATMVISDHMPPTKHHGTGRILDSKSEFRKDTKSVGCIEIGNEAIKPRTPIKLDKRQRVEAIRKAIYELKN